MSASFIPFSMPFVIADMPTRLETPRMIPSIVSNERNLCAQISLRPTEMALEKFMKNGTNHRDTETQRKNLFSFLSAPPCLCGSNNSQWHQLDFPCRLCFLTEEARGQFIETFHFVGHEGLNHSSMLPICAK